MLDNRVVRRALALALIAGLVLILAAVSAVGNDNGEQPSALAEYDALVATDAAVPFPMVELAARLIREQHGDAGMIAFLASHIQRFPGDANNAYYLTVAGDIYRRQGQQGLARQYYRRALLAYPDITVRTVPAHRVAIDRLLEIVVDPAERLDYLAYLDEHYPAYADPGRLAYYQAVAYEGIGAWEHAYDAYRTFLSYPATTIPGVPLAHRDVERKLAFYDSSRDWTHENLDELVRSIKNALWAQNPQALLRHRAREDFFTMSWQQEAADVNSEIPTFDIGALLRRQRIRFADDLDITSNATEAFLRTSGWGHRIPIWYLYFRRVDFPADPEIHGNWEWAGIFFGEAQ